MNRLFQRVFLGVGVVLTLSTAAPAQWSIGQPGTHHGCLRFFQPGGRRSRIRPARVPHPRSASVAARAHA